MMRQTTTRLRKTFQYPDDADPSTSDDDLPEAMDEEEQASLLLSLRAQNAARNKQYTLAFLSLPLLTSLLYLRPLFQPSTSLLSILSISSLGVSAWMMAFLPEDSGFSFGSGLGLGLGRLGGQSGRVQSGHDSHHGQGAGYQGVPSPLLSPGTAQGPLPVLGAKIDTPPLILYLPPLNLVLAALLAVAGLVGPVWGGREGLWFALVPGMVLGVVGMARGIMAGVEGGVRELEGLRYGYKGA